MRGRRLRSPMKSPNLGKSGRRPLLALELGRGSKMNFRRPGLRSRGRSDVEACGRGGRNWIGQGRRLVLVGVGGEVRGRRCWPAGWINNPPEHRASRFRCCQHPVQPSTQRRTRRMLFRRNQMLDVCSGGGLSDEEDEIASGHAITLTELQDIGEDVPQRFRLLVLPPVLFRRRHPDRFAVPGLYFGFLPVAVCARSSHRAHIRTPERPTRGEPYGRSSLERT